jgi:hypothetical protein
MSINQTEARIPSSGKLVTLDTFIRAETDSYFRRYAEQFAGFGKINHYRSLVPIDKQGVVRMNRDTLYSYGIFDLTSPATIHKPDPAGRFQSMIVINQVHYVKLVSHEAGIYTLDQDHMETRYVAVIFRTLINETDPGDIVRVNKLQDQIILEQQSPGKLELPDWDLASLKSIREPLLVLASHMKDLSRRFGDKHEVDPIQHLVGTASGWGGNPPKAALYQNFYPENNDGITSYFLTFGKVPVDGFWSITVYNKEGFIEPNDLKIYVMNDRTARPNADDSFTIRFGGDPKAVNYMPIVDGWNYTVRMYRPKEDVLSRKWTFPDPYIPSAEMLPLSG